jgi:alkylation response protein AidB-like acyl-CoA dehydrogenase
MQFTSTSEQEQLADALRRFLQRDYSAEAGAPFGFAETHWSALAEMGLFGAALPEEVGGFGGGPFDAALIAQELGAGLVGEPFVPVAVIAAQALSALDPNSALLPALVAGEARPVLAHLEAEGRGDFEFIATGARKSAGGYVLNGGKTFVLGGPAADHFLVSARVDGDEGLSLFLVSASAEGFVRQDFRAFDGRGASHLYFRDFPIGADALIGPQGGAAPAIERALDHGLVAMSADALGAMQTAQTLTRDYIKTRKQFGAPIGDNQVLRHRLADMFIETEQARSIVLRAIDALTRDEPNLRARMASAAKVRTAQAGRFVTGQAIQLHGGIGVTEEYVVGHYFKRLTLFGLAFGPERTHLERFARLGGAR